MDPTTLVTFIFKASPEVRTVELLGSWDNFELPYRMHHDRRRGLGLWSGCFKFENIIFDTSSLQWTRPRSGGLRQGGTYWYYYRLNYDFEAFDERQPCTTHCPLLPGQVVNILDVPVEMVDVPSRCRSAYGDIVGTLASYGANQTLDPATKYAVLDPPPKSKIHRNCLSDDALNGRLEHAQRAQRASTDSLPALPAGAPCSSVGAAQVIDARPSSPSCSFNATMESDLVASIVDEYAHETSEPERSPGQQDTQALEQELLEERELLSSFPCPQARSSPSSVSGCRSKPDLLPPSHSVIEEQDQREFVLESGAVVPSTLITDETSRDTGLITPASESHSDFNLRRKPLEQSLGSTSVQSVQLCVSGPATGAVQTESQHRPRTASIATSDVRGYRKDSPLASPTVASSNFSADDPHECPTLDNETDIFGFVSPTFSSDTLSTRGHDTPFRLSANYTQTATSSLIEDGNAVLDDIARRLSSLKSTDVPFPASRTLDNREDDRTLNFATPRAFVNYSLPPISTGSALSLTKTGSLPSAPRTATLEHPLPNLLHERPGVMADAIFSELGYLGSSIA